MPYKTFRIVRRQPDPEDLYGGDWLRLEQPEWLSPPDGGFFGWLLSSDKGLSLETLQEYWSTYKSFCNDDGVLEVEIYVYRSRLDLEYILKADHGELAEGAVGTADRVRYVPVQMVDSIELDVPVEGDITTSWEGPVSDQNGDEIEGPERTIAGQKISFPFKVAGTLKVSFTEVRVVHILTITPRTGEDVDPERPSTAYQSTVRAFWGLGQYEEHEVDLPDMSGNCNRDSGSTSGGDSGGDDEDCVRRVLLVDPCTLDIKDDYTESMACPEES